MSSGEIAAATAQSRAVSRPFTDYRTVAILSALALLLVAVGPYVLPTYMVNSLIRAFLYAVVALTVDILWGYTGILTFGQSAFFGIGAYCRGARSLRMWASAPATRRWRCSWASWWR